MVSLHISHRTATLHDLLNAASGRVTGVCKAALLCLSLRPGARILDVLFCAGSSAASLSCTHGATAPNVQVDHEKLYDLADLA